MARVADMVNQVVHGRVVTAAGVVEDAVVGIRGGVIEHVGPADGLAGRRDPARDAPLEVGLVLPGLVDLHCHGGGGASLSSGDQDEVDRAARHHLEHGTTSVVAGVVTDRPRAMLEGVAAAARACDEGTVLAIHVEGPFLARSRCGAQDPEQLRLPDPVLAAELLDAGRGHVRVMTQAPELPGGEALVELLLERGVVPAVGHTEADAELVRRTLAATHAALGRPGSVTHLFNA
ncbi:MAG: amidohydrolase family protein, partial [Nocardioidaceae bacterium]